MRSSVLLQQPLPLKAFTCSTLPALSLNPHLASLPQASKTKHHRLLHPSKPRTANSTTTPRASTSTPVAMSSSEPPKDQPNFKYTHLWVSADGETHIAEGRFHGFEKKSYSGSDQHILESPDPVIKQVWTQLDVGFDNPWHAGPAVQYVITISGQWYIKTSDGEKKVFGPGDVLFQDNVKDSPCAKVPQHYSGTHGDEPCQQLIVQVDRKPEIDSPLPL